MQNIFADLLLGSCSTSYLLQDIDYWIDKISLMFHEEIFNIKMQIIGARCISMIAGAQCYH